MPLIKSISGIRGTLGEKVGEGLTPVDIVCIVSAYAKQLLERSDDPLVAVGRDGRSSGKSIQSIVMGTLQMCGVSVVDLAQTTTPTVAYTVLKKKLEGGIIITASHNPEQWNALKLLNYLGEFISEEQGNVIHQIVDTQDIDYAPVDKLGGYTLDEEALHQHIEGILAYPLVNVDIIKKAQFKVVVDVINSSGALALPPLLEALGVSFRLLYSSIDEDFSHNPEPLAENLGDLQTAVLEDKADLGIAVDPDVDRLCFVSEEGHFFGEEYTLVAIADYILKHKRGSTVSNLSSTLALKSISTSHGVNHYASKVGEAHVVEKMKEVKAVIGGEGNGGIIVPDFHYGRDAMIGIALLLTHLAESDVTLSQLKAIYPNYRILKDKITIPVSLDKTSLFETIKHYYTSYPMNEDDGIKIIVSENSWLQIRVSNTEPIIRIFAESKNVGEGIKLMNEIKTLIARFLTS